MMPCQCHCQCGSAIGSELTCTCHPDRSHYIAKLSQMSTKLWSEEETALLVNLVSRHVKKVSSRCLRSSLSSNDAENSILILHSPTNPFPPKQASTGRHSIDWVSVAQDFEASSSTDRSKAALAAHFQKSSHPPVEEMMATGEKKEKETTGHGGPKARWSDTEEALLVKSVEKFFDEETGKVNWDKVHGAFDAKGFERSERGE
jgi:hypothetical protein